MEANNQHIIGMLCEGDATTWNAQDWSFDSETLQAQPLAPTIPDLICSAAKRQRPNDSKPSDAPCSGCHASTTMHACSAGTAIQSALASSSLALPAPAVPALGRQPPAPTPAVRLAGSAVVLDAADTVARDATGAPPVGCWVRGCTNSLQGLRDFHHRYHICDAHIKAPQVVRSGRVERFCQQCSRFHCVSEFEGLKRSCRKQLLRHNARRRKRQEEPSRAAAAAAAAAPAPSDCCVVPSCMTQQTPAAVSGHAPQVSNLGFGTEVDSKPAYPSVQPPQATDLERLLRCHLAGGDAATPAGAGAAPASPADATSLEHRFLTLLLDGLSANPGAALSLKRLLHGPEASAPGAAALAHARRHACGAPLSPGAPRSLRLSMKLLQCTPADLPADLQHQIVSWLECAPAAIESAIRPGCVFLTTAVRLTAAQWRHATVRGAQSLVRHLLATSGPSAALFRRINTTIQVDRSFVVAAKGRVIAAHDGDAATLPDALPRIDTPSSRVLLTDGVSPIKLTVSGRNLSAPGVRLYARSGANQHLLLACAPAGDGRVAVSVAVPAGEATAVVWLEACLGGYLSPAVPVLCTRSVELAADAAIVADALLRCAELARAAQVPVEQWHAAVEALFLRLSAAVGEGASTARCALDQQPHDPFDGLFRSFPALAGHLRRRPAAEAEAREGAAAAHCSTGCSAGGAFAAYQHEAADALACISGGAGGACVGDDTRQEQHRWPSNACHAGVGGAWSGMPLSAGHLEQRALASEARHRQLHGTIFADLEGYMGGAAGSGCGVSERKGAVSGVQGTDMRRADSGPASSGSFHDFLDTILAG